MKPDPDNSETYADQNEDFDKATFEASLRAKAVDDKVTSGVLTQELRSAFNLESSNGDPENAWKKLEATRVEASR